MNEKEKYWSKELSLVASILESNNINFFLDHGTLLGAVRDSCFIPWDNDIDLGVVKFNPIKNKHKLKSLILKFNQLDYHCKYFGDSLYLFKDNIEFGIKFYDFNNNYFTGYYIDYKKFNFFSMLYLLGNYEFYEKASKISYFKNLLYSSKFLKFILKPFRNFFLKKSNIEFINLRIPYCYFESFKKIIFYNQYFYIPQNSHEYLSFKYGNNWKKPKENYNYLIDDGAIKNQ